MKKLEIPTIKNFEIVNTFYKKNLFIFNTNLFKNPSIRT